MSLVLNRFWTFDSISFSKIEWVIPRSQGTILSPNLWFRWQQVKLHVPMLSLLLLLLFYVCMYRWPNVFKEKAMFRQEKKRTDCKFLNIHWWDPLGHSHCRCDQKWRVRLVSWEIWRKDLEYAPTSPSIRTQTRLCPALCLRISTVDVKTPRSNNCDEIGTFDVCWNWFYSIS